MARLRYTRTQVARALKKPNQQRLKRGKELSYYYVLDGEKKWRVYYPKGRRKTVGPGTAKKIRDTLRLNRKQFAALAGCPWTGSDYDNHIRQLQDAGQV